MDNELYDESKPWAFVSVIPSVGSSLYCEEEMSNQSSVSEFILMRFSDAWELQILYFVMFLVIYLSALMGNLLIIMAVVFDHNLHNPMNFFLMNLSILDVGTISIMVPKAMANSLMNTTTVSYAGCATQVFFFIFFLGADFSVLTIMAYDHYVVICKPLHYEMVMNRRSCVQMASSAWVVGILNSTMHTWNMFAFTFCEGNVVDLFFCEIPQLLKLSRSDTYFRELFLLFFSFSLIFFCFILIVASYIQIFSAVLRISSEQGRHKAFSTCLPHLIVVSLFVFSSTFAYFKPTSQSPLVLDLIAAAIYSVVPPMMNPIIYSMRNKEILAAMKKLAHCQFFSALQVPFLCQ
ncbi:olfactory receptor 14C36-like [Alligator mississippiensis]|uniref:olfactory receptor 14C36-like n=1 Tax=Alligator mississippiensis TaxID=8496 RepID=UPI00287795A4|nr:olfactory receptor 14C36-like [Alligator mississippiensis]